MRNACSNAAGLTDSFDLQIRCAICAAVKPSGIVTHVATLRAAGQQLLEHSMLRLVRGERVRARADLGVGMFDARENAEGEGIADHAASLQQRGDVVERAPARHDDLRRLRRMRAIQHDAVDEPRAPASNDERR